MIFSPASCALISMSLDVCVDGRFRRNFLILAYMSLIFTIFTVRIYGIICTEQGYTYIY